MEIFVLIDLGSVVRFGQKTASTAAYIPFELRAERASTIVDWWMFAATLAERGCALGGWGDGTMNPSQQKLSECLQEKLPEIWEQLKTKLG